MTAPILERSETKISHLAFLQRISSVSGQSAEKTRAAVSFCYSNLEQQDEAGLDRWYEKTNENGDIVGCGNPAASPFVHQFMR